ncbi:Eco57I restriction-modification methylase domain-containing protein [Methylicorpusculum sp.]|uniref:Eco57I restriction-modification methylase domain-containing protein n=1 Tax=Methylicorpusculum sp. TaxID=2713644 RepID=UPI002ABA9D9C|nr:Eco57I restriction-modification methylase domain-containing protein [Methylicorpusculum sp.]MDZ4153180.1 Eco57I restriction-modification methylase domain-containing protein [Methylicorpusculum sp.]
MLKEIETSRLRVSSTTDAEHKSQFGQFLTPEATARFMAGMFLPAGQVECRLLDAGAGIGSLSNAFIERCLSKSLSVNKIFIMAYEIDSALYSELKNTLSHYTKNSGFQYEIKNEDFIESAINRIQFESEQGFTHAILNPPYKKISSASRYRLMLKDVGIETVNLYSAFVSLAVLLMERGGQIVAIIPRSFCNGPYYKPFRELLLSRCAIKKIHLFESRGTAFKDDGVLQENVIIHLEVGGTQGCVEVTTSTDDRFHNIESREYPFNRIIMPDDREKFIHIPSLEQNGGISGIAERSLAEIGVGVSTGPVVDFRLKEHLRAMPEAETAPLLYPAHFSGPHIEWPKVGIKKPNALVRNSETEKWFYPNGHYCVVRRFSSKEERRRIVACVVNPSDFGGYEVLGFENHLNVFHENRHGMSENMAKGLSLYLNTKMVDEHFRQFSGHTQVNVADLKIMKYPTREKLIMLGKVADSVGESQDKIDAAVLRVCNK